MEEAISNGCSYRRKSLVEETRISGWNLKGGSGKKLETLEEGELRTVRVTKGRSQAW